MNDRKPSVSRDFWLAVGNSVAIFVALGIAALLVLWALGRI
jgi:hypothetical protein